MKSLEQVYGKVNVIRATQFPPLKLPDEVRTVIIYRKEGGFKGQATYWHRNHKWELIGATRGVNKWLYDIPYSQVEAALRQRNLPFKWVPSLPFLSPTTKVATNRTTTSTPRSDAERSLNRVHAQARPL